ncbi:hypothetical protein ACFQRB_16690 [Halobaculum litoreum]|uniref:Uncharacterized protein n=1 Tax=Halobaculum litoreum TaxID=3031998 RepID=A0ABD5XVE3_9EURY
MADTDLDEGADPVEWELLRDDEETQIPSSKADELAEDDEITNFEFPEDRLAMNSEPESDQNADDGIEDLSDSDIGVNFGRETSQAPKTNAPQGDVTDSDKVGEVAEAYTVWKLSRVVKSYLDSHGKNTQVETLSTDRKKEKIILRGTIRDVEQQVEITNVGTERLGYDIHISGAVLGTAGISLSKLDPAEESTLRSKGPSLLMEGDSH